ncbi:TolC family protein [Mangrovibacterium marinum]|uniref:Outer membrane protein TolC n=1 Tax=Mangrovibacterium marinum TaxID=1639118 RepID=A0A2T5C2P3_9BACT|nr:TolC family protein [Mangrovibacterium marinum]PTN08979.1 outer membrane protein TolC [Mangrovibacterium marinum]
MRKIDHLLLLLAMLALPILASSQSKRQLSLQEALQLAEENNLASKSAEARELAARGQYRMTNSVFLPGLTVSTTGVATNDPLSSFGFKLKQEIVTQADFDPATLNDPGRIDNFNTKLEVQQPLLNLDGIYARKAAKNQYEAMSLQTQRVKANIRYQVKKAYFMLELAQNAVGVLETSVKVAEDALKLTKDNEAQGFVKHADVLEAMVRVDERKNQLLEAQNNMQSANEFLAHLLGVDLNTPIETTDPMIQSPTLAVWQASETTIESRSDVQAIQKQIQGAENMLKSEKMKFVPRLNAFGAYEWNDSKLLGTSANNYLVGASLSWNLFGGYKNVGSAQHAKAQLQEAQYNYEDYLSQSQIQLNQAKRNVELKYQQVQSGKLAREQAAESFRIRNDRFAQGLEKTTELLMAEALSSQKNLEFIQAIYNYKEAVFQLELLLEKDINE